MNPVSLSTQHQGCFLVEWYRPELTAPSLDRDAATLRECAQSMSAQGRAVQLLSLLAVPDDETVFAVFVADSASVVAQTCEQARKPARRLTAATSLTFP